MHILYVVFQYTFKDVVCITQAFLQTFKTSRQFSPGSGPGSGGHCWSVLQAEGKMRTDKAAFGSMHQLGIHRGMSQFSRKETESHESEAIHM